MTDSVADYDAIILGAGAAGMFCAAQAGQRGRRVLLIDHADEPGRKILISGGGRCNFTNINTAPDRFLSANPHFAKSALSRFTPQDFIALVDAHGIAWHEKTLGQLFCDGSAKAIVAMLRAECVKAASQGGQVDWWLGQSIDAVRHADGQFCVTVGGRVARGTSLVIATGGPAIPKLGATGFAYDLARQFGLKVVEPRPALVPLTLGGEQILFRTLSGVATSVIASAGKAAFAEAALFTHRGLSGPAILQASSYWRHGEPVHIDFCPDAAPGWLITAKKAQPRATFERVLAGQIPTRLAEILAERLGQTSELGQQSDKALSAAERALAAWRFDPNGSEGYAKAEVTAGGISTAELSSQTCEAKRVRNLYGIGEAVDVTGWLGGYNFQWAWASGWAAAQAI